MPFVPDTEQPSGFVPDKPIAVSQSESAKPEVFKESVETIGKMSPMGLVGSQFSKAMENVTELSKRGGYKLGGAITDYTAGKGIPPKAAAALGFGADVGVQALPVLAGGKIGGEAAPMFRRWGRELMQSALKPSRTALDTGKAEKAITTLLEKGINVTPGGVEKLQSGIFALNRQIKEMIANSPAVIDKNAVVSRLDEVFDKFSKQALPKGDLMAIIKSMDEFLAFNADKIPVQLAQEIKTGTYRALGDKAYGIGLKPAAERDVQKALARGLKEEIAKAVPGIDKLNAKESELLNAESLASARVLMDSNKNPLGLGWLAMHPETWIGFAADRSPFIKSILARAMYSGAKQIPTVTGQVTGAGAAMLSPQPPQ